MKKKDNRILRQRKRKLSKRLERKQWPEQARPVFGAQNIQYEMAERTRAIDCGGIGAFHMLARKTGLIKAIDESLHLLKRHLPYHESDHVLNLAYNTLTGGTCLDDIELHRNDESYMDALGAERIPDPTTEGDFSRRPPKAGKLQGLARARIDGGSECRASKDLARVPLGQGARRSDH